MELPELGDLLKTYTPAHFRDICASLNSLRNELEYTKSALSSNLMAAQNRDNFSKAREILNIQEELSQRIAAINELLSKAGSDAAAKSLKVNLINDSDSFPVSSSGEAVDYTQYSVDDTVAYDIEDADVTFKRPAAFSFKGKRFVVTTWKSLYVRICGILYKENPKVLHSMINESKRPGQPRIKMSLNKADLHSPARIDESNIWVETNRSAENIRKLILTLLVCYRIPTSDVKVYFRRDYAALHADKEEPED